MIILSVIAIQAANAQKEEIPKYFDGGKVENGVFDCPYFQFKMDIPEEWVGLDDEQMTALLNANLTEEQKEEAKGGFKAMEKTKTKNLPSAVLMWALEFEPGTPVEYNPNMMVVADNADFQKELKNDHEFLDKAVNDLVAMGNFAIDTVHGIDTIVIGGKEFLRAKIDAFGMQPSSTDMMIRLEKNFFLSFIINYQSEEVKKTEWRSLESVTFYK